MSSRVNIINFDVAHLRGESEVYLTVAE